MTFKGKIGRRYEAVRGDYDGTTDDRRDRWYVQRAGAIADRRGAGYATKDEALDMAGILNAASEIVGR